MLNQRKITELRFKSAASINNKGFFLFFLDFTRSQGPLSLHYDRYKPFKISKEPTILVMNV